MVDITKYYLLWQTQCYYESVMFPKAGEGNKLKLIIGLVGLILILIGNAFFLNFNAFRGFNFLDMGSFLDASWRIFRGQRPYVDFIFYSGPLHLYMNAFFFKLFGFGKTAILAHLIVVHSIVITVIFFMLFRIASLPVVLAVTALTAPSFYWGISHPWHDQSTHFWGILAVMLLTRRFPLQDARRSFWTAFWCGVLAAAALITKTNIGIGYTILFFVVLLSSGQKSKALFGYLSGFLLAAVVFTVVFIRFPKEYLQCILFHVHSVGQARLTEIRILANWLVNYYWVPPAIVLPVVIVSRTYKKYFDFIILFLGMTILGIFAADTGAIIRVANNFLWGPQVAVAFLVLYKIKEDLRFPWQRLLHQLSSILLLIWTVVLMLISIEYGLQLKVWTYTGKNPVGDYVIKAKPFAGWRCDRGHGKALDLLVESFTQNVPKNQTFLNLSDMYILYALTNRDSYRGVPFVILYGMVPAPGAQAEAVRQNILAHPPDWIIVDLVTPGNEFKALNIRELAASYTIVGRMGGYLLMRKKAHLK